MVVAFDCQAGVYLAYVTRREHALVDVRLYLPEEWTRSRKRMRAAGVPRGVRFRTRHQLILDMLDERGGRLPHAWVSGDGELGRSSWLRQQLQARGEAYLLSVPPNTSVRDLAAAVPYGVRLRTRLREPAEDTRSVLFGVVTETVMTNPGQSGRIVVQCSDGRVIDDEFSTPSDLTTYPGSLVVIEEGEPGRYRLDRVTGDDRVVEVWDCPRLGQVLVYDPETQGGVEETGSRFWVWGEKRWTAISDFNVQPLLARLDGDTATRVTLEYMQGRRGQPRSGSLPACSCSFLGFGVAWEYGLRARQEGPYVARHR